MILLIHCFTLQVRRSLKLRSKRKDKEKEKLPSGITADYSANFFRDLNRESLVSSANGCSHSPVDSPLDSFDSNTGFANLPSSTSNFILQSQIQQRALPLPPLPPRGAKKSSSKSNYRHSFTIDSVEFSKMGDAISVMPQNSHNTVRPNSSLAFGEDAVDFVKMNFDGESQATRLPPSVLISNYDKSRVKSPSIESLTDSTTNSSFATPPFSSSPVGEGQGYYSKFAVVLLNSSPDDVVLEFPLPDITPTYLPAPRELIITRKSPTNDFGFSLRRVLTIDRTRESGQMKSVILAEINNNEEIFQELGLLPGDQLLEVNGVSVNDKTREEVIDLIRSSESAVQIKVSF